MISLYYLWRMFNKFFITYILLTIHLFSNYDYKPAGGREHEREKKEMVTLKKIIKIYFKNIPRTL